MQSEAFAKTLTNSSNMNFLPVDLNAPSVSLKAAHPVAIPLLCCSAYQRSQVRYFPFGTPTISDATFFSKHANCEKCNILIPMYHTAAC
jgi:hypothetical protein